MTVSRKTLEDLFIRHLETILPPEQLEDARRLFSMLSDEEFLQLCTEALRDNGIIPPSMSPQELMAAIQLLADAEQSRPSPDIKIMPQKDARPYRRIIDSRRSPRTVSLFRCEDTELTDFWRKTRDSATVPSDILLAGTVPADDILLEIDGSFLEDGDFFRFRIMLFPDWKERILAADELSVAVVGAITAVLEPGADFFVPFGVMRGTPDVLLQPIGCRTAALASHLRKDPRFNSDMLHKLCTAVLETWYGIQQKLLHPCDDYLYLYLLECTDPDAAERLYNGS